MFGDYLHIHTINQRAMQQIKIHNIGDYALSARLNKILKLPPLETSSILTYRPTIKKIKNKKQHQNLFAKMKQKTLTTIQTKKIKYRSHEKNSSNAESQHIEKNIYKPKIKSIKKKVVSQHSKELQNKQMMAMQTKTQKHIFQTILKLTQQLGMNCPDYANYMKQAKEELKIGRDSKQKQKCIRRKVITSIKRIKTDNSEPLHFIAYGTKYNEYRDEKGLIVNEKRANNQFANIQASQAKFKIKRKDKFRKYKTIVQNEQQDNERDKQIRGWTKYGKLYQQI